MNSLGMRIFSILIFVFIAFYSSAQKVEYSATKEFVLLLDRNGKTIDSIPSGVGFLSAKDSIRVYDFHKGSLPDNCPTNWIFEKSYVIKKDQFILTGKRQLKIYNKDCGSLFNEENSYCFYLMDLKLLDNTLLLEVEDSEDKKSQVNIETSLFMKKEGTVILKKKLDKILLKPSCIEVSDK